MKRIATVMMMGGVCAQGQTTATLKELHVRGDFDNDGRADAAVINRTDGSFRIGYQMQPGILEWSAARASGVPGATWAAVGTLTGASGALAVAGPEANLVSVVRVPSAASAVVPVMVAAGGIGPAGVLALDIGGAGNTAADDLVVFTGLNNAPTAARRELMRHTGGGAATFTTLSETAGGVFRASGRQVARDGGVMLAGVLEGSDASAVFRLMDAGTGLLVEKGSVAGVPGSGYVSAGFGGSPWHSFVFWRRGSSELAWRPAGAGVGDNVVFGAGGTIGAGRPVGEVVVLTGGAGPRLLVVAEDGSTAVVLAFDGVNGTQVMELTAGEGEGFSGAVAREGGGFTMLSGAAGSGVSAAWREWNPQGGGYVAGGSGGLPGVRAAGVRANVFLFAGEPFVVANPGLAAMLNAPEWASSVQFSGNPSALSVTAEVYGTAATGLGAGAVKSLGNAPAGTAFALANQIRPDMSLSSFRGVLGLAGLEVKVSPPSGTYAAAVVPVFTGTPGNAQIFARVGNGPWTAAAGFKPRLTSAATVQYYAVMPGSQRKTAVQTASYSFSVPAGLVDSDGDGVPDFVEATLPELAAIDPQSGGDPDLDGFSDLEEWLAGTDPLDGTKKPAAHVAHAGSFTVRGVPRPVDGTTGLRTVATVGMTAEVWTTDGTRLGGGATALGVPGYALPALNLGGLATLAPLAAVVGQSVYGVTTADPDKMRGRELAGLVAVPRLPVPKVAYVPGNGTTAQEVAAWKAAALAARNASQPVVVPVDLTEHHVLTALVFERWLNGVAVARGLPGVEAGNVTVFPLRPGEAGGRALSAEEMSGLRVRVDEARPGWDVAGVHGVLRAALLPPGDVAVAGLRAVATDVWRISSLLGIGENAADYQPPLDVLRGFVRDGSLPAAYAAAAVVTVPERAAAFGSIAGLLAGLKPRPVVTQTLEVTAQTFGGTCPLLKRVGQAGQVSLVAAEGVPYQLPESFTLGVGSRVVVTGYTDIVDPECPGDEVEVIALRVTHLPVPLAEDKDGNLLPDAWDCFFFAGGGEPLGDSDGDGFSNLQELLDGTDPQVAQSKGTEPVDLGPPAIEPGVINGGDLQLAWEYPAGYAGMVKFTIQCSDGVNGWEDLMEVPASPGGQFEVTLPLPPDPSKFYRAVMSLAD